MIRQILRMARNYTMVRIFKLTFSITYFIVLFYLVFFVNRRKYNYSHNLNIVPIRNTMVGFRHISDLGYFNFYSNLLGNILLFMPLPVIAISVFKINRFFNIMLLCFSLSFSIELMQYVFRVGVADIDDIILNTLGAFIGYCFFLVFKRAFTEIQQN